LFGYTHASTFARSLFHGATTKRMITKTKILIVDPDIDSLSKIYLNLLHRNYKVEACNNGQEIAERLKRLKPSILIIHHELYWEVEKKLKIPAIVLMDDEKEIKIHEQEDLKLLSKPVQTEQLIRAVQSLTI
jgi:DNA-binding response OmpR family regulator